MRQWLWVCVAAVVWGGVGLAVKGQVTAPAATGPARFSGWIHMVVEDGKGGNEVRDWDTKTRAFADRVEDHGVVEVIYMNPATGENAEYHSDDGMIRLSYLAPEEADGIKQSATAPTGTELLDLVRSGYAKEDQEKMIVEESMDRGMKKVEVTMTEAGLRQVFAVNSAIYFAAPATVWVDPMTDRVMEIQQGQRKTTLTYGGAGPVAMGSIYDAGAPKDAKVWDCRPTAETMAVFNRMMGRVEKGLPDGVAMDVTENVEAAGTTTSESVWGIAGKNWSRRIYGQFAPRPARLALPEDWAGKGSQELFRQLAVTWPAGEFKSDGVTGFTSEQFDPMTGEAFYMEGKKRVVGTRKVTGWDARLAGSKDGPMQFLYPTEAFMGVYFTGNTLDLKTDAARPGLVGLHVVSHGGGTVEVVQGEADYWIDPAHGDRPVRYEQTYYRKGAAYAKFTTEFNDYFDLGAPDGRSLPGSWTRKNFIPDGNGGMKETTSWTKVTFHFFAGRVLPGLPKAGGALP